MWTSSNRKFLLFILIIFSIGIISGFLYYGTLEEELQNTIKTSGLNFINDLANVKINSIFNHLLVLSLLIITISFFIGIPLILFYIFYNGFVIGFTISLFSLIGGFKGFIFGLIYNLITKTIFLFFLLIFVLSALKVMINLLNYIVKKKRNVEQLLMLFKRLIVCLLFIFINDLILYFWGGSLVNIFKFLVI